MILFILIEIGKKKGLLFHHLREKLWNFLSKKTIYNKLFKLIPNNYLMKISEKKKEKISEQILAVLYSFFPKPQFTSKIAMEMARDEEFIKKLLNNLKKKNLIIEIKKNHQGIDYRRRSRWMLGDEVYKAYKGYQKT